MKIPLLAAAAAALVLSAPALAKGPDQATITGPGLKGGGIQLSSGGGDPSSGTPLGNLVEQGGWFQETFGQEPDYTLSKQPEGDLGPRYTVEYRVPGPGGGTATIDQDLYPYATPSPVTYTERGQSFFDDRKTHGGWYVASPDLKETLFQIGFPRSAPTAESSDGWLPSFATTLLISVAAALALALVAVAVAAIRRRPSAARA